MTYDIDGMDDGKLDIDATGSEPSPTTENAPITENEEDSTTADDSASNAEDFITPYLKSIGINDKAKIKFSDKEGKIEERSWDSLSENEKLNIIATSKTNTLSEDEQALLDSIKRSGLSTAEYIEYIQQKSIQNYLNNNQQSPHYQIDDYSDDEIFIMDVLSRSEDLTDEEATEFMKAAKANETVYKKQVEALRSEYRKLEEELLRLAEEEQNREYQAQFEEFSNNVASNINEFTSFSGFNLNMSQEEKDQLQEFIVGQDAAGNNYFAKALADPKILVQTAWFALHGEEMIDGITSYYEKQLSELKKKNAVTPEPKKDVTTVHINSASNARSASSIDDY